MSNKDESVESQLDEIVSFLDNTLEVRKLALDHVLGFTATDEGRKSLKTTDIVKHLCKLIHDKDKEISQNTLKCLVNLSSETEILDDLVERNIFPKLVDNVKNGGDAKFMQLNAMLLCNLTHHQKGSAKLMHIGDHLRQGLQVSKLIDAFVFTEGRILLEDGEDAYSWVAQILMNVTQIAPGRDLIMNKDRNIIPLLLPFIRDVSERRRLGILGLVKNCCIESEHHAALLSSEVNVLAHLLYPLRGSEPLLSVEDEQGLDISLHNVSIGKYKQRESIKECRSLIIKCFSLLSTTRLGRDEMRAKKVYPILRDLHKVETDEQNADEIHDVVTTLMLMDEEGEPSPLPVPLQLEEPKQVVTKIPPTLQPAEPIVPPTIMEEIEEI